MLNLYLQLAAPAVTKGKYQGLQAVAFGHNKMVRERAAKLALSKAPRVLSMKPTTDVLE
jgi:hypothetical protein